MKTILIAATLAIAATSIWIATSINNRIDEEDLCRQLGGVPVKSSFGDLVCLDSEAVLDISIKEGRP